jgi:hypothetical protein
MNKPEIVQNILNIAIGLLESKDVNMYTFEIIQDFISDGYIKYISNEYNQMLISAEIPEDLIRIKINIMITKEIILTHKYLNDLRIQESITNVQFFELMIFHELIVAIIRSIPRIVTTFVWGLPSLSQLLQEEMEMRSIADDAGIPDELMLRDTEVITLLIVLYIIFIRG